MCLLEVVHIALVNFIKQFLCLHYLVDYKFFVHVLCSSHLNLQADTTD